MGALDEIGGEFMNMLLAIGALLLGVGAFILFTISIWLLIGVLIVVGVGFIMWKK